ncbi:MAG: thioredoxin family protein [Candidatus Woesearchaeota archaeon]
MKRKIVLPVLLMLLLVMPLASASLADWVTGNAILDWFTGKVVEGEAPTTLAEQDKCVFVDSTSAQDCYTDDGAFKCSGISTCLADVSGESGKTLGWKSSCGGYATTVIDGNNDDIMFICPTLAPPAPTPVVPVLPKEQVKCVFSGSTSTQKCYAGDGKFSCYGTGSCVAEVSGETGTKLQWTSTSACSGVSETIIDGQNDEISFNCQQNQLQPAPETPAPTTPTTPTSQTCTDSDGGKNYEAVGIVRTAPYVSESTDYCNDGRTLTEYFCQESGDGKPPAVYTITHWCDYSCKYGVCQPPVCGNGVCESEDEKTNCAQDCPIKCHQDSDCGQPTKTKYCGSPPVGPMKTVYPDNSYACTSETYYKCESPGTADARCGGGGGGTCVPCAQGCSGGECLTTASTPTVVAQPVKGPISTTAALCTETDFGRNYGTKGYIKTQAGGQAEDKCESAGYLNEYYCVDDMIYSDRIMCPYGCKDGACLQEPAQLQTCKDTDGTYIVSVPNGILHPPGEDRYVKGSVSYGTTVYEDSCSKITHYKDSFGNENIKFERSAEGSGVVEAGCLDGEKPYETSYFECPDGCRDGACLKKEAITEQVTCIFTNSDREQECYIGGSFTDAKTGEKFCRGKDSCIINVQGNKGEQAVWKSTCGGYQYTTQDGNNEEIRFECKQGETNIAEITNKGFRSAYWQCYDGSESKSGDATSCKPSEDWQKHAAQFCTGKCYKDLSKCGVNTFSVWNDCYAEGAVAHTIPAVSAQAVATATMPVKGMLYYFRSDTCPHCSAEDTEIGVLKKTGFFNNFGAALFNINEPGVSEKYGIKAVPTFILYKDGCSFRTEGFMKSDEIETWAYNAKCAAEQPAVEPILVCKDSCPSDGKCYPFGYRKDGNFCSDEGKFTGQSEGEQACENSFECSSNVCLDGTCVSSSLIQKFFDWVKNLFG